MGETDHNKFMKRCLDLASKAEGLTYPNPMVGSVIVHDGIIIGEGFHLRSGEPHAEVNAINSVSDKSKLNNSTLYVNLEPCSHFGKTPPCADFIIANSIPRVVIGTRDITEKVSGKGIKKLKAAGCEVISGVCEEESRRLNRRFFTYHEKKRPYIILKWAQSADGFLDIVRSVNHKQEPNWITGKPERVLVHKWRASEQAILVGAATLRADNPKLNVREWSGTDPIKIILSSSGNINIDKILEETTGTVIVFSHSESVNFPGAKKIVLNKLVSSAQQIADYLWQVGIQSLLIEGGAKILNHFIDNGSWDEARVFTGRHNFNEGVKAPVIEGTVISGSSFPDSSLKMYLKESNNK